MASSPVRTPVRKQAKAILGALMAGLTSAGYALADGHVTPVEGIGIALAVIASYGTVFGISNGKGA